MSAHKIATAVGVVGAGRWGTTLAHLAAGQGSAVTLWCEEPELADRINATRRSADRLPGLPALHKGVHATSHLLEIAQHCQLVLLAVPAARLRPVLRALGDVLDGSHLLVHAVRGMEVESGALPSQIIAEETCVLRHGALLGAALVDELLAGHPNAVVIASRFGEVTDAAQRALQGSPLRLRVERDVAGIEAAAAAASALALALGIADGLGFGPAARASLTAQAARELTLAVQAAGGEAASAQSVAGLGYLLVEREADSRDVQAGRLLAKGKSLAEVVAALGAVDGAAACRSLAALCVKKKVQVPVISGMAELLAGSIAMDAAVARYLAV